MEKLKVQPDNNRLPTQYASKLIAQEPPADLCKNRFSALGPVDTIFRFRSFVFGKALPDKDGVFVRPFVVLIANETDVIKSVVVVVFPHTP